MNSHIVSKEPWWKTPPKPGQTDDDLEWGYLIIYDDGRVEFTEQERPTPAEIANRKGCRLDVSGSTPVDASCPLCDGLGYVYEGGLSFDPTVDNKIPCTECRGEQGD